jgi:hypothetical protein
MNSHFGNHGLRAIRFAFAAALVGLCPMRTGIVRAQDVVATGLLRPAKIIQTPLENVLVAEVGTAAAAPNTGRVSIVDRAGNRRTLIGGLPSAPTNASNTPSGPSGLFLRGRTLFVAIGEGNATLAGPAPRTEVPNPARSSPIFSSVLAINFSVRAEMNTSGVSLTLKDHHALKAGSQLVRSDAKGHKITIELVVDFPDYIPEPVPALATNVRHSHPYGVVADDDYLYVVDGGYNSVHKVEIATGQFATLLAFPVTPNPTSFGPPIVENVPTSIRWDGDRLLVTVLSGFPFVSGLSQVRSIDPDTGDNAALLLGLTSAIDVIPLSQEGETAGYLTLEYSLAHLAGGPGRLQVFDQSGSSIAVLATDLITPSSMVYDRRARAVIVSEINTGTFKVIPAPH